MALSRYKDLDIIKDEKTRRDRISTFPPIRSDDIKQDDDLIIKFAEGDRIDILAQKFLGNTRYWWAICLLNDIHLMIGDSVKPGTMLRIPASINPILELIRRRANER
jgi:hypothetical protein